MNFLKADLIKMVALGCDFFASFILALMFAIQGDERTEAISALVLSVALPTVVYIVGAIISFIYIVRNDRQYWVQALPVMIGGLLYLVGDNLPPVMEEYGGQLNCTEGSVCFQQVQAATFGLLVISAIGYFPSFIHRAFTHKSEDEPHLETPVSVTHKSEDEPQLKTPVSVKIFALLASLTELDLVYTAIQRLSSTCPDNSTVISTWVYWALYTVAFLVLLLLSVNTQIKPKECFDTTCSCIHSILIFICLALYLLADNTLPLACTDSVSTNTDTLRIIQASLWAPTLTIALYALIFTIGWKWCCQKCQCRSSYPV